MPARMPFDEALAELLREYEETDPEEIIPTLEAAIEVLTAKAEGKDPEED